MNVRIHRMPSGSSPLTGSSNISTCGSPSSAPAMPSRWLMPSEKRAAPSCPRRRSGRPCRAPRRPGGRESLVAAMPGRWLRPTGRGGRLASSSAPTVRIGSRQLAIRLAVDGGRARRRVVQAEDQPHRGGLARAVGPQEAGDPAGLDRAVRSSTAGFGQTVWSARPTRSRSRDYGLRSQKTGVDSRFACNSDVWRV